MDVFVAATADHKGLAPSHRHQMDPPGPFPASGPVEIGELADVVKVRPRLADLAALGEEPADQLALPNRATAPISAATS